MSLYLGLQTWHLAGDSRIGDCFHGHCLSAFPLLVHLCSFFILFNRKQLKSTYQMVVFVLSLPFCTCFNQVDHGVSAPTKQFSFVCLGSGKRCLDVIRHLTRSVRSANSSSNFARFFGRRSSGFAISRLFLSLWYCLGRLDCMHRSSNSFDAIPS